MPRDDGFGAHLRVALEAALLLALCQVVVETILIAVYFRHFVLSPHEFSQTQMYDFCVKLFVSLPGAGRWIRQSAIDVFLPEGMGQKLAIGGALVVPNLVISLLVGFALGATRRVFHRPLRVTAALAALIFLALGVDIVSYVLAIHIPKAWTAQSLVRNSARVFFWDGAWIAFCVLALAGGVAGMIARLQLRVRWAVLTGGALTAAVAGLALTPARAVLSATGGGGGRGGAKSAAVAPVSNVLLISIDSLRADHLGCYGNAHDTSPAIDRLAREGVRFANATSTTSWTLPAHMSLLTGRYVLSHGVMSETDKLAPNVPTLAASLRQQGLDTGGVVSALWLRPQYGFDRGFNYYDDSSTAATLSDEWSDEPAPRVTEKAIQWLRQHGQHRFFLFVHFWDVHYDYDPPAPYDTMFDPDYEGSVTGINFIHNAAIRRGMAPRDVAHLLALYDGEIRWVDDHVARILGVLDEMGVSDHTAVVVTADHGDEFFEHGGKGHQHTLYREVVHVPLIMRVPGAKAGRVVQDPVSLVDVMPTVLELTGAPTPAGVEGNSLVPALVGGVVPDRSAVYGWLCNPQRKTNCEAMRESPADTLIHIFQPTRVELYASSDTRQKTNLAHGTAWNRHQRLTALSAELNSRWKVYRGLDQTRGAVKIDRATMERLRALGYAD